MNSAAIRFSFIDSMRGIAALWVMLFHFYHAVDGSNSLPIPDAFRWFFELGDQGVFIFFVLSGFVISKAIEWKFLSGNYFLRFLLRRSIRLDIPYWVVIVMTGLSVGILGYMGMSSIDSPAMGDYLVNFFYLDNLTGSRSIVAVGWTLQYEIQFYLVFILAAWLLKSCGLAPKSAVILFYISGLASFLYWFPWFPFHLSGLFINYWMFFLLGVFTEWVTSRKIKTSQYILLLAMVMIHGILFSEISSLVCLFTSVLLFFAGKLNAFNRWLNFKWLIFTGTISYSIYLLHPFLGNRILRFVSEKFHPSGIQAWLILAGVILVTLGACYVFYRLVERPSIELSRKVQVKME